jgi:Arc/MetJ-type ribon-helix-helix transcriptional regulator
MVRALANNIVSVRIPRSLADRLSCIAKRGHYLSLSEEVRSIVRKKWLSYSADNSRIDGIKKEIKEELAFELRRK